MKRPGLGFLIVLLAILSILVVPLGGGAQPAYRIGFLWTA